MARTALALATALVLLLVPGLGLLSLLGGRVRGVRAVALAPAVSLGMAWLTASLLDRFGLPVEGATLLPVLLGVPIAAALRTRRRLGAGPRDGEPDLAMDRWDVLGLLLGPLLALAVWCLASDWLSLVTPNDDGAHHGLFVARIVQTASIDPTQVLVGDVLTSQPSLSFYPLALHVVASLVAAVGVPVALALNVTWVTASAVGLASGTYVLARRTFPDARRAAVGVAVVASLLPEMPFDPLFWGGIGLVAGMAIVPGVVDAVLGLLSAPPVSRAAGAAIGAVLGVAAVGVAFTHTSEVVTLVVVLLALVVGDRRLRSTLREWRRLLLPVAVGLVVAGLGVSAYVAAILGTSADVAAGVPATTARPLGEALPVAAAYLFAPGLALVPMVVLVVTGAVIGVRRRQVGGWLLLVAVVLVLWLGVELGWPGWDTLTRAWYSHGDRVAAMLVYPAAMLAGFGGWWLARTLRRRLGPAPFGAQAWREPVTVALCGGLVALLAVVPLWSEARHQADLDFELGSLVTPDMQAAFDLLVEATEPGERVLNDFADGSSWMYANDALAPLFDMKVDTFPPEQWDDRQYLLAHAAQIRTDRKARALADRLQVRFAIVGPRLFPDHEPSSDPPLTVARLVAGGWRVVFEQGGATVLERPA